MEHWSKETVEEWLRGHSGKEISLRTRGGSFSLLGICKGIDELDGCSKEFIQCAISLAHTDADASLSFHDDGISVHLLLLSPHSGETILSMAVNIPYDKVVLTESRPPAEAQSASDESEQAGANRSPYELLH